MPAPVPSKRPARTTTDIATDTGLDGSYTLTHIAPGSYYVIVREEGYITPITQFQQQDLTEPTEKTRSLLDKALTRVYVEQDSTAHADVQLERGAAVSGAISYDDGAPAANLTVLVLLKDEHGKWIHSQSAVMIIGQSITNDRGVYRIASLPPGTYLLEASLSFKEEKTYTIHDVRSTVLNIRSTISFYGEGIPRIDDTSAFTLRGGDERTGQDMVLPISKLHRIVGRVTAGSDGHLVKAATIEIFDRTSADDHPNPIFATAIDPADGFFHFEFIPEGDYTLRITHARDITWEPGQAPSSPLTIFAPHTNDKEHVLERYGDVDMPLLVRGDMTDIVATIPPKKN